MSGLFSKPKEVNIPKPKEAAPVAVPVVSPETEDEAIKKARRKKGFEKQFFTGALEPESTGRKTTFG